MADVDLDQSCTLNKKIRTAQLAQFNFIFGSQPFSLLSLIPSSSTSGRFGGKEPKVAKGQ